jgi:hypothetical protein
MVGVGLRRSIVIWLAVFLGAVLIVGIPYWRVAYAQAQLPSVLMGPPLLAVVLAAFVVRRFAAAGFARATFVTALVVPCVVMARVTVETSADPTSHNLWPFEVVIGMGVGILAAAAGALLGSWPRRHV